MLWSNSSITDNVSPSDDYASIYYTNKEMCALCKLCILLFFSCDSISGCDNVCPSMAGCVVGRSPMSFNNSSKCQNRTQ